MKDFSERIQTEHKDNTEPLKDNAQYWPHKTFISSDKARGYIPNDLAVSLKPASKVSSMTDWHANYFLKNYGIVDPDIFAWAPEVVVGPIPADAVFDESAPLFILYMSWKSSNLGHLMFDEFYPWYNLMNLFDEVTPSARALNWVRVALYRLCIGSV